MRVAYLMLLLLVLSCRSLSEPTPPTENGMLLKYHTERLASDVGESEAGSLSVRSSWIVISGKGVVVGYESSISPSTYAPETPDPVFAFSGALADTENDPGRMRQMKDIIVMNGNASAKTIRFFYQINGTPVLTARITPFFNIPGGGSLWYNGSVWVIYDENGLPVTGGV